MRLTALLIAALAAAACGDNMLPPGVPLGPTANVAIVAHQDDDLLFMQPDLLEAIRAGGGATNVYVTAGNNDKGADEADPRYAGLREAYGYALGNHDWRCGSIEIHHHIAQHCRLEAANLSLVFLAYPDGGRQGELSQSLLKLWEGEIDGADSLSDQVGTSHYDREGLIDTVADVIRLTSPTTLRTLDVQSTHGRDHIDHLVVGALAMIALARADNHAAVISYRGYNTPTEPANRPDAVYAELEPLMSRYEACAMSCGDCGGTCSEIDRTHQAWLHRRYATAFRTTGGGALRFGDACLAIGGDGMTVTLGDCATAPVWALDAVNQLRTGALCLHAQPGGALDVASCGGGPERTFFLDDEGHLWSALPPPPAMAMDYAHLTCVTPDPTTGSVTAALCGDASAPVWELAPPLVATPRASLGLALTGRAVRLGDLTGDGAADLCEVDAGGLRCAPGDGHGGFAAAQRIDDAAAPLAIDPASLAIGDVDGDGAADACGRDANGVLCALAATGFAAVRWTAAFGASDAVVDTDASLAVLDGAGDGTAEICGFGTTGVACAPHGATFASTVRSAWPRAYSTVWPADLDGDGRADWCTATDTGLACGAAGEAELTTDGVPWGYSLGGVVEITPADPGITTTGDIDGDGRADLCNLASDATGDRITCAHSQGRGFSPHATFAILPAGVTARALWLGDLDGDGRADACADLGDTIACAVQPPR